MTKKQQKKTLSTQDKHNNKLIEIFDTHLSRNISNDCFLNSIRFVLVWHVCL